MLGKLSRSIVFVFAACALGVSATAADLVGKVVAIADGDTLTVLVAKTQHKVRLVGIDTPEKGQPFGDAAKKALSGLVFGKTVRVVENDKDRYGRTLGVVWIGQINVNLEMVRGGWAWHFVRYSTDKALAAAELEARKARRGLWQDKNPTPPWEWRKQKASR